MWADRRRRFVPGRVDLDEVGRVRAIGPLRAGERYEPWFVTPGLVNAHCHLQLAPLVTAHSSFVGWLGAVIASRTTASPPLERARLELDELLGGGCTAVGEIDSSGDSPVALRTVPLAGRCYRELLGFDADAEAAARLLRARDAAATRRCRRGLSPHAPYSVSLPLLRAAVASECRLAVHLAETPEEVEFLRDGRGPFRELLDSLGKLPPALRSGQPPHGRDAATALDWLDRGGALRHTTSLIHAQHLEAGDADRIAAAGASIVVCPGTIRYFARNAPPVAAWRERRIPVAIGTDSAASNPRGVCDVRAELSLARRIWPELSGEDVLEMATEAGGETLGNRSLGRIRIGPRADLAIWHVDSLCDGSRPVTAHAAADLLTCGAAELASVWLGGVEHRFGARDRQDRADRTS